MSTESMAASGMSAEDIVEQQRSQGYKAGEAWAQSLAHPADRLEIIAEADRRYPHTASDYFAAYNLSGGFIDGATSHFKAQGKR